jgi:hypothetical protein
MDYLQPVHMARLRLVIDRRRTEQRPGTTIALSPQLVRGRGHQGSCCSIYSLSATNGSSSLYETHVKTDSCAAHMQIQSLVAQLPRIAVVEPKHASTTLSYD